MKLFFADTETTGLDPAVHELFQFSFIVDVDGKAVEEADILARPARPENASKEALEVTQKSLEELSAYPPRKEAYDRLIGILAKHIDRYDRGDKFIWVGQNPSFDVPFVRAFFKEHGDPYFGSWWDNRPADTISLAVACKARGLIDPPDFKLGTLAGMFRIPLKAHDALEDVRATRKVFRRLQGFLRRPKKDKDQLPLRLD